MHNKLKIKNPPMYTAAASVYPYSKALETHFLVATKYDPDPIFLAKKVGNFLHVPRELCPVAEDDRRAIGSPMMLNLKVQPRDENQVLLIGESMALLNQGISHTFQAVMGFGKSFCGTHILAKIGKTALIVVTKEDLMVQWKENLLKYTDIKEEEIGIIQQNVCQYTGKKVCIGMVHSLAGTEYPPAVYDYFGMIVVDECLTGDALVTLESGESSSLEQIVAGVESGNSYTVMSYNEFDNIFEPKLVTKAWRKGVKKILRLTLASGETLKCTEDHLIHTINRGWVPAGELTYVDDVSTMNLP